MKYYCMVLFCGLLSVQYATGQALGIKTGANVTWLGGDSENVIPILRYHFGLFNEVSLVEESLTLRPELYYSAQGSGVEDGGTARYHYFCLPILAKLEYEKHYFLIGPQAAVLYQGNLRHEEARQNVTARLNPVDISVVLGGGIKISPLANIELRYHWGLSDAASIENGHFPNRLLQLSFTQLLTRQL